MQEKPEEKKAVDTGFVAGIYNYCDRWCDRCKFQDKCMSYTLGTRVRARTKPTPDTPSVLDDKEYMMARLKLIFDTTQQVLRELAQERNVPVEEIYHVENLSKRTYWGEDYEDLVGDDERISCQVANDDIALCCRIYDTLGGTCLDRVNKQLEEDSTLNTPEVEEAVEVVSWYLDIMRGKFKRALYGYFSCSLKTAEESVQEKFDFQGSAKVALLALQASQEAWGKLLQLLPSCERDIRHLLIVVKQLELDVHRCFPNVLAFKRPGLDE